MAGEEGFGERGSLRCSPSSSTRPSPAAGARIGRISRFQRAFPAHHTTDAGAGNRGDLAFGPLVQGSQGSSGWSSLPLLIVFVYATKPFMTGVTSGAYKA